MTVTRYSRGVRFADLTGAFSSHGEAAIYIDSCCHVNGRGNAVLADLMFEAMRGDRPPGTAR